MSIPDYRTIFKNTDRDTIIKSMPCTYSMYCDIANALDKNFNNEEINLFARLRKNKEPVYVGSARKIIISAIEKSGSGSDIVSLLTRRFKGKSIFANDFAAMTEVMKAYDDGIGTDRLQALIPEGRMLPFSRHELHNYIKAIIEEYRTPDEIEKCVSSVIETGKITRAAIFEDPTSLSVNNRGYLSFSTALNSYLSTIPRTLYIEKLEKELLSKDPQGRYCLSAPYINSNIRRISNLTPEQRSFLEIRNAEGDFLFPSEYGLAFIDAFDAGYTVSDVLSLAATDENGNLLFSAEEINKIIILAKLDAIPSRFYNEEKGKMEFAAYVSYMLEELHPPAGPPDISL